MNRIYSANNIITYNSWTSQARSESYIIIQQFLLIEVQKMVETYNLLKFPTVSITNFRTRGQRLKGIENRRAKRKSKSIKEPRSTYEVEANFLYDGI